jgi:iron only hydrogenase large subunit-like protein
LTDASWSNNSSSEPGALVRDVDCVITSRELLSLASSRKISLPTLPKKALPQEYRLPFPDPALDTFLFSRGSSSQQTAAAGTSGGYLYSVLLSFQARNPGSEIVTQRGRNADVVEYALVLPGGETIMKAARYYGFRNIQNLVRKLKPARASRLPGAKASQAAAGRRQPASRNGTAASSIDYAYVEVMACPGGCTNGGGQIRIEDAREVSSQNGASEVSAGSKPSPHEQRSWLARVDEAYYSAESDIEDGSGDSQTLSITESENRVHKVLQHWSAMTDIPLAKLVYTTYREVESDVGKTTAPNDTTRVVELAGKIGGGW